MSDFPTTLEQQFNQLFKNVEGWNVNALKRIGRRVKEIGSLSHADLQALNNATIVKQDIKAIIDDLATLTEQSAPEVLRAYSEALKKQHLENKPLYDYRNKPFIPFAENKSLQAIVKAYARTTLGTMVNLSMTKARAVGTVDKLGNFIPLERSFKDVLDKAVIAVSTGTGDFNSEMRDAIRQLGGSGMRIDYGGGITRRVDSMVRQNLLWGAKQASVEYNEMIGEELGCDGIEIDWHSNPRPSHEFMQGEQYSLYGKKTIKGVVYEDAADALSALQDYGCLHYKTPIILGVSEPRYSPSELARLNAENKKPITIDGVTKTGYEWKQTMRALERESRITKEQMEIFNASGDKAEVTKLRQRVKAIDERYYKVAEGSGIKAQPGRMAYTKGVSKAVDNSGKKWYNNINMEISKAVSTGGLRNEIPLTDSEKKEYETYAREFGFPSDIDYSDYISTGFVSSVNGDRYCRLVIGTDVKPVIAEPGKKYSPNQMISPKGAIAHEVIGHYEAWLGGFECENIFIDEAQASIRAARFAKGLTQEDRILLLRDAIRRLKNGNIKLADARKAMRIDRR